MSDSSLSPGRTQSHVNAPRAVIHKKILDAAESRPEVSMEELAETVSGATTEMVENVLDEYGDPAESGDDSSGENPEVNSSSESPDDAMEADQPTLATTDSTDEPTSATDDSTDEQTPATGDSTDEQPSGPRSRPTLEPDDVTEKQLETLREIREYPTATQAKLAENLGVTSATISQRVNGIDGFDWSNRQQLVAELFDLEGSFDGEDAPTEGGDSDAELAGEAVRDGGEADESEARIRRQKASPTDSDPPAPTDSDGAPGREGERGDETADFSEIETQIDESLAGLSEQITQLSHRLETLEATVTDNTSRGAGIPSDPELVHKMLHACLTSEQITEDEELRIVEEMLATDVEPT
ncbi:winged helix-turn-helix transcriptional regulator [Natrarchaeobius chitinivorans]|uniref:Winged helix-turn-helix transcriptional regulator n=1 Tax=Natrarchaeobius chitinivorans TaxID=1679083 RepID=A0A3N6N650_NATCH|nr:winged helix-turn-helix transcriptional regulator [Natrarchaeobius chitinivorans]RQG93822.1 winged helix-turn-helix transcriptional regulator [Natrarchaeobius chitinivorans]